MTRIGKAVAPASRHSIRVVPFVGLLVMLACVGIAQARPLSEHDSDRPTRGCTTLYAFDGKTALAGNNEDFCDPLTYLRFVPASPGRFGCVYFVYEDGLLQGGLNDQGVFFDDLSLPYKPMPITSERPRFPGGDLALLDQVLSHSTNVQDAIQIFYRWDRAGGEYSQLFYGDQSGDAVIVDGDRFIHRQDAFLLATNFRALDSPNPPYPDARYGTLQAMLQAADRYDVDLFRQALDAAHAEGDNPTLYSQIYELDSKTIHLFQYHDFENAVVLDLAEELAKGPRTVAIESLFPANAALDDWARSRLQESRASFEGRVRTDIQTESQDWMCGEYTLQGAPRGSSGRVSIEGGLLHLEALSMPAVELRPSSSDSVLHQYVSGVNLALTFQRNLWGQTTGARGTLSYKPYGIEIPYNLTKHGVLSYRLSVLITIAGAITLAVALAATGFVVHRRSRRSRVDP